MGDFVRVASVDEIPPGRAKTVVIGTREIALFNVSGNLYALENTCPHQGGPLAEGGFEGDVVSCPWHGWCFHVTTGHMTLGDDLCRVDTFDVRVVSRSVYVASEPRA